MLWRRAVQEQRWKSGGIHRQERLELLQAVQQGFEELPHRLQGIIIKQRSHALPQQPLAAEFCPDGSEQRTAQLLRLVDQKRQHHHHGKHHGEMLLAMAVVVLKVVALIFQPTLSRCSERKNRLPSAAYLTASRSFRGGLSHGTGSRRASRSPRLARFCDQRLRAD